MAAPYSLVLSLDRTLHLSLLGRLRQTGLTSAKEEEERLRVTRGYKPNGCTGKRMGGGAAPPLH